MPEFFPAFKRTMWFEGKILENVKGDTGGQTYWGIARNKNPQWDGWPDIDSMLKLKPPDPTAYLNNSAQLHMKVVDFYRKYFWDAYHLDEFPTQELAAQFYDATVNMGGGRPTSGLQSLVGLNPPSGFLGPTTLAAIKNFPDQVSLPLQFLQWRRDAYASLVRSKPERAKFLPDWLHRCKLTTAPPGPATA